MTREWEEDSRMENKERTVMKNLRLVSALLFLAAAWLAAPRGHCASNVVVTPSTISADYQGEVTVTANVGTGDDVLISVIVDFNGNGNVDGSDGPFEVYSVKDRPVGALDHIGRVVDRDGAQNGHVQVVIPMYDSPHFVGDFVVVVEDGTNADRASFTVNAPASWTQTVTGSVVKGLAAQPAVVLGFLFLGDTEVEVGTVTDQNGNFTLALPSDGYWAVGAFYPGLLTDLESGSAWFTDVGAGSNVTLPFSLMLFDGTYTISGRVDVDTGGDPGAVLPPFSVFMETAENADGQIIAIADTDAAGNFSLPAVPGSFELSVENQNALGIVVAATETAVTDRNVTGVNLPGSLIEGVITGTVVNQDPGQNLEVGLEISAGNSSNDWVEVDGVYTNGNGDYAVGVTAGDWGVSLDESYLAISDYIVLPPAHQAVTVAQGQTVSNVDFTIAAANTFLTVQTREGSPAGPPVPDVGFGVFTVPGGDMIASGITDASGNARMGIFPGDYRVEVASFTIQDRGYAQPAGQEVTVPEGGEATVTMVLEPASATATIRVWDTSGSPVAGAEVSIHRVEGEYYIWAGNGTTDGSGQVAIPVNPGDYIAYIANYLGSPDGFVWNMASFSVLSGENVPVDLYLFPEQATLNVHTQDTLANPVQVEVVVTDEGRSLEMFRTWTDGTGDLSVQVPAIPLEVSVNPGSVPAYLDPPAPQSVTPAVAGTEDVTFVLENSTTEPLTADINGDRVVDQLDLLILMQQWKQTW